MINKQNHFNLEVVNLLNFYRKMAIKQLEIWQ